MAVSSKTFGKTKDGQEAKLYTISNKKGFSLDITDFGANIVGIKVPNKDGSKTDVVLGYDNLAQYEINDCFFGSTIGPSANRIADAKFTINGKTYNLVKNDGENNLHSDGNFGYHKRIWNAKENDNSVIFSLTDNATMGFPGNKNVQVTFTVTEENEVKLDYYVTSDADTLINMTNHVYFNLEGHDKGTILNHKLQLLASNYTPVVAGSIPTGEIASVKGTPFDFLEATIIGDRIDLDNEQLRLGLGYDHNWCTDNYDGNVRMVAELEAPISKRKLQVYTDQPGLQFYAGNCIGDHTGKDNAKYGKRTGLALESHVFPNSINQKGFPDAIYGPGKPYKTTTIFKFI